MLHAVLVRSPVAHARIRSVDLSRAGAATGVAFALNAADLLRLVPPMPKGKSLCRANGLRSSSINSSIRSSRYWRSHPEPMRGARRVGAPRRKR
jgi:CO/xanthine dehydrogenase Mo-binding subunit